MHFIYICKYQNVFRFMSECVPYDPDIWQGVQGIKRYAYIHIYKKSLRIYVHIGLGNRDMTAATGFLVTMISGIYNVAEMPVIEIK